MVRRLDDLETLRGRGHRRLPAQPQQQVVGRLALDVAEQEGVDGTGRGRQHQAGVVGDRAVGDPARRAPDRRVDLADGEPVTGVQHRHRDAVCARHAVDLVGRRGRLTHRTDEQLDDGAPVDGATEPVDVVGVEVGEHDGVEGGDAEVGQAAVDQWRVGAGVDEDRAVRAAAQHDGVALADVADDDPPAVGRPGERAGRHERCRDDERGAEGEHRVGRDPGGQRPAGEQHGDGEGGEEQRTRGAVGPGQGAAGHLGEAARDLRDDRRREHPGPRHELGGARRAARDVRDAATPATVATGTSGAASRLARTPTTLTEPWSSTTSGAVIAWAATGMARAGPRGARRRGSRAPMASPHGRVKRSRPSVAREDRANPNDRASHGSTTSTTTIAAPSTGGPAERRERLRPISPIAPIAAARTTLGSGRASTTKPASASSASGGRQRRGTPRTTHSPSTRPVTTATLLPLTAVRCVMPVARIAAVRSGGVRLVSPMTRPGRRPRASGGARSTAERRPARSRSAAAATAPGWREDAGVTADREGRDAVVGPVGRPEPTAHQDGGPPPRPSDRRAAGEQHRRTRAAPQAARVEDEQGRLAQHDGPVAAAREHDRVAGHHRDGRDRGPVGRERLDAAPGAQDAVGRGRDLQPRHEEHRQRQRPEHPAPTQAASGRWDRPPARGRAAPRHRPPAGAPKA